MDLSSMNMEQALLCTLLTIPEAYFRLDGLTLADFAADRHQLIFKAIQHLADTGVTIDALQVLEVLRGWGVPTLERAGGEKYLSKMLAETPAHLIQINDYAKRLREYRIKRDAVAALSVAMETLKNRGDVSADEALSQTIDALTRVTAGASQTQLFDMKEALRDFVFDLENPDSNPAVMTGFYDLDTHTGGLEAGDLVVVAARPSMGKTAFAVNVLDNIARATGKACPFFSLEMDKRQITRRIVSARASVSLSSLRSRDLSEPEWQRITPAIASLTESSLHICDQPGVTLAQVRASCNQIARLSKGGLGAIMIDYLQIMGGITGEGSAVVRAIGDITSGLKALAKQHNCPVILLSQLNRSVEQRPNKRPLLSDLRESGAIEQDADQILFLYRDEYYTKEACKEPGVAEVIVGKHRNGATGTIRLAFQGQYSRFSALVGEMHHDD